MTPNAYLHLDNDTLRIDVDHEKKMQVPLHHIGAVVCFGNLWEVTLTGATLE